MSQKISLKAAEKKAFRTAYGDGLWDVFLGCFFLNFVIGPYLSPILGDFWSSMVFLPFYALVYLIIWLIRKQMVTPRVGVVKFGLVRRTRLARLTVGLLIVNVIALIMGFIAAVTFGRVPGQIYSIGLGMTLLIVFSFAAYFLDFNRLYIYGLMVGFSPLIGEWLWTKGYVTHHGLPVTFGISAGIMVVVGIGVFIHFLRDNPIPMEELPAE